MSLTLTADKGDDKIKMLPNGGGRFVLCETLLTGI
jgi:hypothetical protein